MMVLTVCQRSLVLCKYDLILCVFSTEKPRGLLGNANGDVNDDLQSPANVIISPNATSRRVHEEFGVKCRSIRYDA